jgi:hypothetical protein
MNKQYNNRRNNNYKKRNNNKKRNNKQYEEHGNQYYHNIRQNNQHKQKNNGHQLNTHWTIYVHDINDRDWSLQSYKNVFTMRTLEDFWVFFSNYHDYQRFQFFIMRGDIKPTYEDPANIDGGSFSYMVPGKEVNHTIEYLSAKMVAEQLVSTDITHEIKGISLVPKRGISILKIWLQYKNKPHHLAIEEIQGLKNGRFQPHKF